MNLKPGEKCDLETLTELYDSEETAAAILLSANEHKTIADIESGKCTLPDPHEAISYVKRQALRERFADEKIVDAIMSNPALEPLIAPVHERSKK